MGVQRTGEEARTGGFLPIRYGMCSGNRRRPGAGAAGRRSTPGSWRRGRTCVPSAGRRKNEREWSEARRYMTLLEMSVEYRAQAQVLRRRISELELRRANEPDATERLVLEDRIRILETMWREARDLAVVTERYYDRGYWRNVKYAI